MGECIYLVIFVSLPTLLILSWIVSLIYTLWWKPKTMERYLHEQGIYGPSFKFMYGNMKEMNELNKEASSKSLGFSHDIIPHIDPFTQKMLTKYGKVYVSWMGTTPLVNVFDQTLIKEILLNKSGDFVKMEITPISKLFVTGISSYDGEKWAKHRRILNPAFHMEKLKQMLSAFSICCDELIEKWDKLVAPTGSYELDVSPEFTALTGKVISRAAFGSSYEEGNKIFQLQVEQVQLIFNQYLRQKNFRTLLLSFLPAKPNSRMLEIYQEIETLVKGVIKKKEKAMEMGESDKDLLGMMLELNLDDFQRNESSKKKLALSTYDIIEEVKLFYFAGQETLAKLLTWTMILISMHSTWQDRAREEVLQVIGKNKPTFDDLQNLKFVNMIFYEVLRLYPPTYLIRRTRKETKLGKFTLPANLQLKVQVPVVHRDPEQWGDDANEFNPNRFSQGISNASKDQLSYYPFGGGPRICIGQNFALVEAKLALAKILQNYYFELSPTYTHAPMINIILGPGHGAPIVLHKL